MPMSHFPNGISNYGIPLYGSYIPPIIGTYYHVCPGSSNIVNGQGQQIVGSDGNNGLTPQTPLASLQQAYNMCVDGAGDGIIMWNYGGGGTLLYLTQTLNWTKNNITVVGVSAPVDEFPGVVVLVPPSVNNVLYAINFTGSNNSFINFRVLNSGTGAYGAATFNGTRNYFYNIHFDQLYDTISLTSSNACSMFFTASGMNIFEKCTIGGSLYNWVGTQVTAPIKFSNNSAYNTFYNCKILTWYSASNATSGAIHLLSANAIDKVQEFKDCSFINHKVGKPSTNPALSLVVGTPQTNGPILFSGNTSVIGYAAYDAVGGNDMVYISSSVSSAVGGISVSP